MDVGKVLAALRQERARLDEVIVNLERLEQSRERRRGRPPAALATAFAVFAAFERPATAFFPRRLIGIFSGKMLEPIFFSLSLCPRGEKKLFQIQVCF